MEIVILLIYLFLFCSSSYKIVNFANAYTLIEKDKEKEKDPNEVVKPAVIVKYEDKYVENLQNTLNAFSLSDDDQLSKKAKYDELLSTVKKDIDAVQQEIASCEQELSDIDDFETNLEKISQKKDKLTQAIVNLKTKLTGILEKVEHEATEYANGLRLERLAVCYLFETTPLGNLIMRYNNKRETFEYYSDCSIPYRYLETACRKYVITYKCRPLYVDMGAELKEYEQKMLDKENEQKEKEKKEQLEQQEKGKEKDIKKKSVFAKFKSYNTEAGTGRVNTGAPSKNNIQSTNTNNRNEKVILKENANRYSYQGKINNFSILLKVDKKLVNKKYKMSFADFKKQMKW